MRNNSGNFHYTSSNYNNYDYKHRRILYLETRLVALQEKTQVFECIENAVVKISAIEDDLKARSIDPNAYLALNPQDTNAKAVQELNIQIEEYELYLESIKAFTGVTLGAFLLPGGKGGEVIVESIIKYLDVRSLGRFITTSILKQLSNAYGNSTYLNNLCCCILLPEEGKYLNKKYKEEFPEGDPFIVACEKGNLKDVETFVKSNTVKDINKKGRDSGGRNVTPLQITTNKLILEQR